MWVLVASDRAFDTPCLWRGVPDQLLEPFDGAGQCDEFVESGAACPGDPAGEELFSSAAFGGEDRAELFLEQVGAVEGGVRGPDLGQALSLVHGEVVQGRPPARYPRYADPFPPAPHRTGNATYHRTRLSSVQFRESCHVGRP